MFWRLATAVLGVMQRLSSNVILSVCMAPMQGARGRVAQRERTCLARRGLSVRIRSRPPNTLAADYHSWQSAACMDQKAYGSVPSSALLHSNDPSLKSTRIPGAKVAPDELTASMIVCATC